MATSKLTLFQDEVLAEYPKQNPIPLTMEGLENIPLFLTGFRGAAERNYQVNYALGGDVYFYVFGDKLSLVQLDGLAILPTRPCPGATINSTAGEFVKFYNAHKLAASGTQQISLTIGGGMVFTGYFVALTINLVAGRENTFIFSLSMLSRIGNNASASP